MLGRLLSFLVKRGVREALRGGSTAWLVAGSVAWLMRFLMTRPPVSVVTEELALGESLTVTHVPAPPYGRAARKLAKPERDAAKAQRKEIAGERKKAAARPKAAAGAKTKTKSKAKAAISTISAKPSAGRRKAAARGG